MTTRCYSELLKLNSFEDRFAYLKLGGKVGNQTFGFDRYINQRFYHSTEWKLIRIEVIVRDEGCDLGVKGYDIHDKILIHHMNPMQIRDIQKGSSEILDPNFLICVSPLTHQAIHYGDKSLLPRVPVDRKEGDTKLW